MVDMSVQRQPTPMEMIASIARDPSIPIDRITALIGLQERMEARDAEKQYHAAMAQMQPVLPRVKKNGTIDLGGSNKAIAFAKWEDVDAVIRPILSQFGFTLSFPTRVADGVLIMGCVVSHIAGHSERSEAVVGQDAKLAQRMNSLQATGSGRQYTKRYLALDMLNIVTVGADDDANSADPISEQQANDIDQWLSLLAMTPTQAERFWAWVGPPAVNVGSIQKRDYDRVAQWLKTRVSAQGGGK